MQKNRTGVEMEKAGIVWEVKILSVFFKITK